eukprot:SAG31_NODE_10_length_40133_cov_27.863041_36_plen_304_part_00
MLSLATVAGNTIRAQPLRQPSMLGWPVARAVRLRPEATASGTGATKLARRWGRLPRGPVHIWTGRSLHGGWCRLSSSTAGKGKLPHSGDEPEAHVGGDNECFSFGENGDKIARELAASQGEEYDSDYCNRLVQTLRLAELEPKAYQQWVTALPEQSAELVEQLRCDWEGSGRKGSVPTVSPGRGIAGLAQAISTLSQRLSADVGAKTPTEGPGQGQSSPRSEQQTGHDRPKVVVIARWPWDPSVGAEPADLHFAAGERIEMLEHAETLPAALSQGSGCNDGSSDESLTHGWATGRAPSPSCRS